MKTDEEKGGTDDQRNTSVEEDEEESLETADSEWPTLEQSKGEGEVSPDNMGTFKKKHRRGCRGGKGKKKKNKVLVEGTETPGVVRGNVVHPAAGRTIHAGDVFDSPRDGPEQVLAAVAGLEESSELPGSGLVGNLPSSVEVQTDCRERSGSHCDSSLPPSSFRVPGWVLLLLGPWITVANRHGNTLAHYAASLGFADPLHDYHVAEWLNRPNAKGYTPLMLASERNHYHCVACLCSVLSVVDSELLDVTNNENESALHLAVSNLSLESVHALRAHGCRLDIIDSQGHRPEDILAKLKPGALPWPRHEFHQRKQLILDILNPELSGSADLVHRSALKIQVGGDRLVRPVERVLSAQTQWSRQLALLDAHILTLELTDDAICGRAPLESLSFGQLEGVESVLSHLLDRIRLARAARRN
jgi:hypothetical protein